MGIGHGQARGRWVDGQGELAREEDFTGWCAAVGVDADPEYDEPAGEKWLVLQPQKWNKHVQYAWRFDPCELLPQGSPRPPPRAPRVDPAADEEEYLEE